MENPSLLFYIMYLLHQTYAIDNFPLLRYLIWDMPALFIHSLAWLNLFMTNRKWWHYRKDHRENIRFW